ncbi:MAG: M14 family zinc carboxypeptidase [Chitinophagaceae bacterium]|nr:M14 family zinc carboxypeptidase [Chitinophagaceae bacterium]
MKRKGCRYLFLIFMFKTLWLQLPAQSGMQTRFEKSGGTQTATYSEIIDWWKTADRASKNVKLFTMGQTDAGYPLHLALLARQIPENLNFENIRKQKSIILFNNGIHPGEPDGIDASMLFAKEFVKGQYRLPEDVMVCIIPVYNIGGCLNRSRFFRVNQNGPEEIGFRGNSRNLDLNRDMIKCDSREARSLIQIFHLLDPDVFVDHHVSNGADYQHVMTLISTQSQKLGGDMGKFLRDEFEPSLFRRMKDKGWDMAPYVNVFNTSPENGWTEFWDSPRYTSGFAALWHTFAFVPETHMLKPYAQRVSATLALMKCFVEYTSENRQRIKQLRQNTKQKVCTQASFPIRWKPDKKIFKTFLFKGYEAGYKISGLTGQKMLYYDRSKPFEKNITVYDGFEPVHYVTKPGAYIIPQGWWPVVELLQLNNVKMYRLARDTVIKVEVYKIEDYKTLPRPYEMHHLNSDVRVSKSIMNIAFRKNDWYIPMNQVANRFLTETLEPEAEDSFFAWNFFDAILGQKEGFSAYVFEDSAAAFLRRHPEIQRLFEQKKNSDTAFAANGYAQLNFIYQLSPWMEPTFMRYPVFRVLDDEGVVRKEDIMETAK